LFALLPQSIFPAPHIPLDLRHPIRVICHQVSMSKENFIAASFWWPARPARPARARPPPCIPR